MEHGICSVVSRFYDVDSYRQRLNAALNPGLFQDSIGKESGDDCHGYGEVSAGYRAAPYFMAALALSDECTSMD